MTKPILLVDDSPHDIEFVLFAFRKCGVQREIIIVSSGEEALDYLFLKERYSKRADENPALIFLDLNLPTIDGIEVLKTIKSAPRTSSIPVISLTDSSSETNIQRAKTLGVDQYIIKPMATKEFVKVICEACSYYDLT